MSTRGLVGIIKNGSERSHMLTSDAYPTFYGKHVFQFIASMTDEQLSDFHDWLHPIPFQKVDDPPSLEEHKKLCELIDDAPLPTWRQYFEDRVERFQFWHMVNFGVPWYFDETQFLADGLFSEWAYLINLDSGMLEVHVFNHEPEVEFSTREGRYVNWMVKPLNTSFQTQGGETDVSIEYSHGVQFLIEIPLDAIRKHSKSKLDLDFLANGLSAVKNVGDFPGFAPEDLKMSNEFLDILFDRSASNEVLDTAVSL